MSTHTVQMVLQILKHHFSLAIFVRKVFNFVSFKCNICQQKSRTENMLREHMKLQHIQFVSNCKNEIDCRYGPKKCWFIHKEDIEIAYKNAK